MKLFTAAIVAKLVKNAAATAAAIALDGKTPDHKPVVKIFSPTGSATWLLTELHKDGSLFGLCDLGMGSPELGYVSRAELEALRSPHLRLPMERDLHFTADKGIRAYATEASAKGRIVS